MTKEEKLELFNRELGTNYTDYDDLCKLNWGGITLYHKLSEEFIREFKDNVCFFYVSRYQKLSEGFIRDFKDEVDWFYISAHQKLSEDFIQEFQYKVKWYYISMCQKLSENFIRKFQYKVNWYNISMYQELSENFIREFQNKVDWYNISKCQKLSEGFIREFEIYLNKEYIKDNWLYQDKDFLKDQVKSTGLYECYDDYFIAYKGIRNDRYSKFNFQYRYMSGETYESFCDCSNEIDSFGLSVWTKEKAREYCYELVVKVRVNYEDVGRVVHNGGKIRCRKITVLD